MSSSWPNGGREIRIARGRGNNLGRAENKVLSWKMFCALFDDPPRTSEKHKAYLRLPKEEQDKLKSADGWYLGGHVTDGNRRKSSVMSRDVITIDIDECSPELLEEIKNGFTGATDFEFVAHTTRKHTPEAPRLRLNFPVSKDVARDEYDAVARILAHRIDPSMDAVDDVSFRVAQMMFMPTLSANQAYETWVNKGPLLDAGKLLKDWPSDWRDYNNLPFSESRGKKRKTLSKAENPLTKRGPIGAFCRAYDVEEAIAAFIPDIYLPGDGHSGKPRYSYAHGSTSNGVVVEDDGLFIYSHHGTDPCSDQLVNAFDMVRIHLFGHEDDGKDFAGKPVTERPSFKAMFKFAKEDNAVSKELIEESLDMMAMFDDIPDGEGEEERDIFEGAEDPDDAIRFMLGEDVPLKMADLPPYPGSNPPARSKKGWHKALEPTPEGKVKSTVYNVQTIVANDARLHGVLALNVFSQRICAMRPIRTNLPTVPRIEVPDPEDGLEWSDTHDVSVRTILEAPAGKGMPGYGMKVSDRDVTGAIDLVSTWRKFHPVINRLVKLEWDGKPRVERLFVDYLGCPDTPYHRETARQFLLGCIARVFCPGHKFDFVPVLFGPQGIRKSTFIAELAFGKWGGELTVSMDGDKDAVEQMTGRWILELGELVSLRRSEIETVKSFLSRTEDRVRLAYDRRQKTFPRQCLFMGSTNRREYLKDNENRRFWHIVVTVPSIDTEKLRREIDQIWAEAMVFYRAMIVDHDYRHLPFGLRGEAAREALLLQESARVESGEDQILGRIEHYLDQEVPLGVLLGEEFEEVSAAPPIMVKRVRVCVEQLVKEALHENPNNPSTKNALSQAVGSVIRDVKGWIRYSTYTNDKGHQLSFGDYGRQRAYVREDATREEITLGYRVVESDRDPADDIL